VRWSVCWLRHALTGRGHLKLSFVSYPVALYPAPSAAEQISLLARAGEVVQSVMARQSACAEVRPSFSLHFDHLRRDTAPRALPYTTKGRNMSNSEALEIRSSDRIEPEYRARPTGRGKYAIVLSGEQDAVVGWGYDEASAIRLVQALNQATNFF
jgi:hypothetical protein